MNDKEKRLIECFNKLFGIKPITYGEFNKIFKCNDSIFQLEKKYPELGLTGDENKGFSIISLMATITDFLCGKRFAVIIDNDNETTLPLNERLINGVTLIDFNEKGEVKE